MTDTIVTVTTPRTDSGLLVTLAALKTELQITGSTDDVYYTGLILRGSQAVESYCQRVFAVEGIKEVFRFSWREHRIVALPLTRFPVASIVSVKVDDGDLTADDYEVVSANGDLYRLSGNGRVCWGGCKIEVNYTAGYATIPGPVQQGVFEVVKLQSASRTRDPSIRSESFIEGLYSYSLFNGENMDTMFLGVPGLSEYINRWAVV